jgi:large repetitive protein
MTSATYRIFVSVGACFIIIAAALIFALRAHAAPPDIVFREGAVAVSSSSATYTPNPPSPVTFSPNGACPRWSGTINDNNLTPSPINSSISASDLDAGDIVTFAITLQNTSDSAAFDVILKSSPIPAGLELPGAGAEGANVCVRNGAGSALPYTTNGSGFFGATADDHIELTDSGSGALSAAHPTNGQNIAVITFDLRVTNDFNPGSTKTVESELINYSDQEGGGPIGSDNDTAIVTTGEFGSQKTLQSTNQPFTTGNDVVVGEEITYALTVTVPEGNIPNVRIVDTLTPGLTFIECVSVTNNNPSSLSTNLSGGLGSACNDPTNPTIANNGQEATFTLGDFVNSDRNELQNETFTIVYRAVVNNVAAAANAANLNNSAAIWWNDGHTAGAIADVTVREAHLTLDTTTEPTTNVRPGDIIHVTINLEHAPGSLVAAQGVRLRNTLPAGLTYVPASLNCSNGTTAPDTCAFTNNSLGITWASFGNSSVSNITFDARVDDSIAVSTLNNDISVDWSSLPGDVSTPLSQYATTTTERTGNTNDAGGTANSYSTGSLTAISVSLSSDEQTSGSNDTNTSGLADTGMAQWPLVAAAGLLILAAVGTLRFTRKRI